MVRVYLLLFFVTNMCLKDSFLSKGEVFLMLALGINRFDL